METRGERIRKLREAKGYSPEKLARVAGLSGPTIRRIESGEREDIRGSTIARIASALDVPPESLLLKTDYPPTKVPVQKETPEEILERYRIAAPISIPVYDHLQVHMGSPVAEPVDFIYMSRQEVGKRNLEAYKAQGHCLEPTIESGDIIIIDRELTPEIGNILLCLVNNEVIIGRYRLRDGEAWLCNKEYESRLCDCQLDAVVIGIYKKLR